MATRAQKLATKARQQEKNKDDNKIIATPKPPTVPATPGAPTYGQENPVPLVPTTDKMSFANIANAMLPYFSTADQQSVRLFLNTQDPTGVYKDYLSPDAGPLGERATGDTPAKFMSADRAKQALTKLDTMRTAAGLTEEQLGSGYKLIRNALNMLQQLGAAPDQGVQFMTRAKYEQLQAHLNALTTQAEGDKTLAPYAELASKFINPTLLNSLFPKSTNNGVTIYGQANRKLY